MLHRLKTLIAIITFIIYPLMAAACTNHDASSASKNSTNQPALLSNHTSYPVDLTCIKLGCWAGIFPGTTTAIQAQILLETLYGKDKVKASINIISWQTADLERQSQFGELRINVLSIVDEIDIVFPSGQLTIAELINQLKDPTFVYIARAFSAEAKCAGSFVSYPNAGLNAWLYPNNLSVGIQPSQFVQRVELLRIEDAANTTFYDTTKLKWEGYKEYCSLIDK